MGEKGRERATEVDRDIMTRDGGRKEKKERREKAGEGTKTHNGKGREVGAGETKRQREGDRELGRAETRETISGERERARGEPDWEPVQGMAEEKDAAETETVREKVGEAERRNATAKRR